LFLDVLGEGIEAYACGPEDESCWESVSGYFSGVGVSCFVVYFISFNFGDAGVCDDVDIIVFEFTFCVVGDFLVVRVEDVRLTLHDMNGDFFS